MRYNLFFTMLLVLSGCQQKDAPMIRCPDCNVLSGHTHKIFCGQERCPFCQGQLITCGCIKTVLKLTPDEIQAVDEYIDDSVEPLKSINERWEAALNEKGRVPFE